MRYCSITTQEKHYRLLKLWSNDALYFLFRKCRYFCFLNEFYSWIQYKNLIPVVWCLPESLAEALLIRVSQLLGQTHWNCRFYVLRANITSRRPVLSLPTLPIKPRGPNIFRMEDGYKNIDSKELKIQRFQWKIASRYIFI